MSVRIDLPYKEMPTHWYNILPDLPRPLDPPLNPETKEPVTPDMLAPLFPMALIEQEVSQERYIEIPDEVLDIYRIYRPTPLIRASNLEKALDTPAKIYYKWEGVSPAGSHKPNTAIAQAYYNKEEGVKRLTTETGAGQWGSALALACCLFGLECTVYMVRISYEQKIYRRSMMQTWGAEVFPSPSERTNVGRAAREQDPDNPGSLGLAISEAIEDAVGRDDTKYSLGSVLNHVLLHQTIVGQECMKQMEIAGDYPDVVIGCHGGGSNYAGLCFPFVRERLVGGKSTRFIAVEPTACPTLTRGVYTYDYGDVGKMTPLLKMHTLGSSFIPPKIHAGGLRYHGAAPLMSLLIEEGIIEAVAYHQNAVFEAATMFARAEGHVPAPETAHAIRAAIDEALAAKEAGEERVILFNGSGHGHFDMAAYDEYFAGQLIDYEYPSAEIERALEELPKL